MFTLQTSFKPLLLKWGGGVNTVVEETVNSKEENSNDFCPSYVQEFGLSSGSLEATFVVCVGDLYTLQYVYGCVCECEESVL